MSIRYGSFTRETYDALRAEIYVSSGVLVRNFYWADYQLGDDSNTGTDRNAPVKTLAQGLANCADGLNDAVVVLGDGTAAGSQRLSGAFDWNKDATHCFGAAAPSRYSNRARIAPTSGATAFANFFTVSGNGCLFQNLQWFQGFGTGTTAEIAVTVTGSRNVFAGCHIAGMGDAEGAADAGSRMLKISGGEENLFQSCVIGLDTTDRDAANANIEFAGGTARNVFDNCTVKVWASDTDPLGIIVSAAAAADRDQHFRRCAFLNTGLTSGGSACAAVATLAASMGGALILEDCIRHGFTEWGTDATSRGQIYVGAGGVTVNGHTGGETVVASQS